MLFKNNFDSLLLWLPLLLQLPLSLSLLFLLLLPVFFSFQLLRRQVAFELVAKIPTLLRSQQSELGTYSFANGMYRDSSFEENSSSLHSDKKTSLYPGGFNRDKRKSVSFHNHTSPPATPPGKHSRPPLHLRGQMKFMKDWKKILYICSPLWV